MVSVTSINTTRSEMAYMIIKMLFLLRAVFLPSPLPEELCKWVHVNRCSQVKAASSAGLFVSCGQAVKIVRLVQGTQGQSSCISRMEVRQELLCGHSTEYCNCGL